MKQTVTVTADGSFTIINAERRTTYHSLHGAEKESRHVFINAGLEYCLQQGVASPIAILEMGFGTGFNAYLTGEWLKGKDISVNYETVEKFPLPEELLIMYGNESKFNDLYKQLHQVQWNQWVNINDQFCFLKQSVDIFEIVFQQRYDLVFYDAFAPSAQPELWTEDVFKKIASAMKPSGILVTYCAKGIVKRALKAAGFKVNALPGPPRKREMIRAVYVG